MQGEGERSCGGRRERGTDRESDRQREWRERKVKKIKEGHGMRDELKEGKKTGTRWQEHK
jgi:hypothetical protein